MKRLFEGKVYDLQLGTNAVVFSYFKGETKENQQIIFFKMVSLENGVVSDAPKSVYFLTKFGTNYLPAVEFAENYVEARALSLSDGKAFVCNRDGTAALFDINGEPLWQGILKYRNRAPSAIAMYGENLWGSFEELNALLRFSTKTLREELRIGGKNSILKTPKSLFIEDSFAYLSLGNENKIVRINLITYEAEDYLYFDEPVHDFVKSGEKQFVALKSGVYMI